MFYFPCKKDATNFNFPTTVKELSGDAFSNNILTSIIIPKHITTLNDGGGEAANSIFGTFYGCKNLTSLTFERGENYTYIPSYFLTKSEKLPSFIIPETVLKIGRYAFSECKSLTTQLPSKLESIERNAFQSCNALKEITFSKTLSSLGVEAFNNCGSLEKLTIPDDCVLTYIPSFCFRSNKNLRDVKLSGKIEAIHDGAFEYCNSLPTIDLSKDLRTIGERAFSECRRLKDVKFYNKLEAIHEGAFSRCSSLKKTSLFHRA
ncbi:leucine-rich repeat domain-containing protein [Prevotella falsenii]|uniref:leucine-rich repeat domain-containing protein n=1 Tax=Prevotella falsenii TaxID=515414 RepID=UPI000469A628|nr:leucine-rich repeat domain-containing protein [Prevotella falsenii]